jgi:hypothetical protein
LCGRFTSKGSKRVLIDYYLSSLPMYTVILWSKFIRRLTSDEPSEVRRQEAWEMQRR